MCNCNTCNCLQSMEANTCMRHNSVGSDVIWKSNPDTPKTCHLTKTNQMCLSNVDHVNLCFYSQQYTFTCTLACFVFFACREQTWLVTSMCIIVFSHVTASSVHNLNVIFSTFEQMSSVKTLIVCGSRLLLISSFNR